MTEATDKPKGRVGRPPMGKRGTFAFRVTDRLRAKLEAEAQETQRPVSEVIEARLYEAYALGDVDQRDRALASALLSTVVIERARAGYPWYKTDKTARFTLARIVFMLSKLMGVESLKDIGDEKTHQEYVIDEYMAKAVEENYSVSKGLGGGVYTAIRDFKSIRWLNHGIGSIDYLLWLAQQDRGTVLDETVKAETNDNE